jgi:hypothetical protein
MIVNMRCRCLLSWGPASAEEFCPDRRRVKIWRVFRCYMAELSARFVDSHERELHLHRRSRPEPGDSCSRMREKEIVRVQKDEDRTMGKRPATVLCSDLTPVRLSQNGSDPVVVSVQ